MNLIEVKDVALGYDNKVILKHLSFSVEEGDFLCIIGANGSGKSTLVKNILGLIAPISGTITYHKLKQRSIGYMSQETNVDANFPASVREIVLSGCLNNSKRRIFYSKSDRAKMRKNLELLHIEQLADKSFCNLSGGQRQKVLLARSLCATHKLLVLDEPSNNLDYKSKMELYELLRKLNKEKNITIIMITHDLDSKSLIGNKVLSLSEGDVFFGTKEKYLKEKNIC